MRSIILGLFLFFSLNADCDNTCNSPEQIKVALSKIKDLIDSEKSVTENPLSICAFDSFSSRGYLYYWRSVANYSISKNKINSQKKLYLELALKDLKLAKLSPGLIAQEVDLLLNDVLKDLIEIELSEKKYNLVINKINQLSQADKLSQKFVFYYAYALYKIAKKEDLRRLFAKYSHILSDEKIANSYLPAGADVKSFQASLPDAPVVSVSAPVPGLVAKYSRDFLLANPREALKNLNRKSYFSDADQLFKLALNLYFVCVKKPDKNFQERNFLRTFQRAMYDFNPVFMDELISAHWKQADLNTATRLSNIFLKAFEGNSLYPKVLFNLGRIQEDMKNYRSAFARYKQFLESSDHLSYLELARFRIAWVLYLNKQNHEAVSYFREYMKNYPDGRYASTCEYFILKNSDSRELVSNYIKKYPFNLYSFILADELKLSKADILDALSLGQKLVTSDNIFKADIKTISQLELARELISFGLRAEALKILKSFSSDDYGEEFALYLATQFNELQNTHGEVKNLVKVISNSTALRKNILWTSLYPKYRLDLIDNILVQQKSNISAFLILSIIRQESLFEPQAISSANAQGLMQLTQGTAQDAARRLGLKEFSLLKEEDNLRLGITTLSYLLKKFDNRLDFALCAYNAGETTTRLWVKLRGHLAPIEFIESIPFQETRLYVKNILRNYAIYQLVYDRVPMSLVSYNCEN